jgi:hypothetical protein
MALQPGPAGPTSARRLPTDPKTKTSHADAITEAMQAGRDAEDFIRSALGAKPKHLLNPLEQVSGFAGESINPMGKATLPTMAALTAYQTYLEANKPKDLTGLTADETQRQAPEKPFDLPAWLLSALISPAAAQEKDAQGFELVPKDQRERKGQRAGETRLQTLERQLEEMTARGRASPKTIEALKEKIAKEYTIEKNKALARELVIGPELPRRLEFQTQEGERVVDTAGGPAKVKESEYGILGGIAAVTLGMLFGPRIFRAAKLNQLAPQPKIRDVVNAYAPPGGLGPVTDTTLVDLARTHLDDVNRGLFNVADRAGVPIPALMEIEDKFALHTRGAAQALVEGAVTAGRIETPTFRFKTDVPLGDLMPLDTPEVSKYLFLKDTLDEIKEESVRRLTTKKPVAPGPITIRNYDLPRADAEIKAMERANPGLIEISKHVVKLNREIRKFESTGEYGTITPAQAAYLNKTRPNFIPFPKGQKRVTHTDVDRGRATLALNDDMQVRLRTRMENEAGMIYRDSLRKYDATGRRMIRISPVKAKVLNQKTGRMKTQTITPSSAIANQYDPFDTVSVGFRRGQKEYYSTDPFIASTLKMDPYVMPNMMFPIYGTKRMLEIGSTGQLAPWFAITSPIRSWAIMKLTTPSEYSGRIVPGFLGGGAPSIAETLYEVPAQLLPQVAKAIGHSLDNGSARWLNSVFGPGTTDMMGSWLSQKYMNSLHAQLRSVGSARGDILQQQAQASRGIKDGIRKLDTMAREGATDPLSRFSYDALHNIFKSYTALLEASHAAPQVAFIRKHKGKKHLAELATVARHLTGDPKRGGQFFVRGGSPIPFQASGARAVGKAGVSAVGATVEVLGRGATPWFNQTVQGIKRIGEAYIDNPIAFTARLWLYTGLPIAMNYLFTRSLGKDPNGMSYDDYRRNYRSDYNQTMYTYIPIPGRPASEGIELPRFHETSIYARLLEAGFDHMFRSSLFHEGEDFMKALNNFAGVAIQPPVPPLFNMALATQGLSSVQGIFSGDAYRRRAEPYDQRGGLSVTIEGLIRAFAGGAGDVFGQSAAAFTQTPEGVGKAFENAVKAGGRRIAEKTPVVRDVLGIHPPTPGNTPISEELHKKQKHIDQMVSFFREWHPDMGAGLINLKPQSKRGGEIAVEALGPLEKGAPGDKEIKVPSAGISQPPPTNPLYDTFIKTVYNLFKKDDPAQGGIGQRSIWNRYGDAAKEVRRLSKVNEGNAVTWKIEQSQNTPMYIEKRAYLRKHGVDPYNVRQVREHYENIRQDTARVLLFTIRRVEDMLSKQAGQPIKLEDLDPYGSVAVGYQAPGVDPTVIDSRSPYGLD